jgi:hypothetical protein
MAKPKPRRKKVDVTLRKLRSAITNGSMLLADCDHRGAWMRRLRDLIAGLISDGGGEDALSEAERVLVRRCAMLALQCELLERRFAENNGEADHKQLDAYQRATGALRRTLEALGLKRRTKDVTPSLDEYLRDKARRRGDDSQYSEAAE